MKLYTASQVRDLDRIAIEEHGIPGYELMQNAARAAFDCLREQWPEARRIVVACGGGNNAGDGFVLARLCQQAGLTVTVFCLVQPARLKGDAEKAYQDMLTEEVKQVEYSAAVLEQADVIVDALLGTGLQRLVEGQWLDVVQAINHSPVPVLSIDIPSGLNADTGMAMGASIKADSVVSFIGRKRGLYTGKARACYQKLHFFDLGVPEAVYQKVTAEAVLTDYRAIVEHIRPRSPIAHKGDNGHVLCIGGDRGYSGAIRMAAESALRAGAGLVSIATRAEHAAFINQSRPELMCHAVAGFKDLDPLVNKASVILIGPGLGQSDWAKSLLARVREVKKPIVFDADAINLLAEDADEMHNRVITPHPGEAARLLQTTTDEIQADRFKAMEQLLALYGGSVILKGNGTLVSSTQSMAHVCAHGNPGMASGGMGDVLSGIVAALLAQHYSLHEAALIATVIHSRAADLLAEHAGEVGLLATDLIPVIRQLLNNRDTAVVD